MSAYKDMSGLRFGRLTVLSRAENSSRGNARWNCICDCGNKVVVSGGKLREGKTKSCGCLWKEKFTAARARVKHTRKENQYRTNGRITFVKLPNSPNEMIVNTDVWESWAKNFWWRMDRGGYAYTKTKKEGSVWLHAALISNCPPGMVRDHIDGNRLNNTKENLRVVTPSQNMFNRKRSATNQSGQNGVYFHKETGKWAAEIKAEHAKIYLGLFSDKEQAIEARKQAEKRLFGEYRRFK